MCWLDLARQTYGMSWFRASQPLVAGFFKKLRTADQSWQLVIHYFQIWSECKAHVTYLAASILAVSLYLKSGKESRCGNSDESRNRILEVLTHDRHIHHSYRWLRKQAFEILWISLDVYFCVIPIVAHPGTESIMAIEKPHEHCIFMGTSSLPSGKCSHNYGKSPCYSWVNPLFPWPCSIANSYIS